MVAYKSLADLVVSNPEMQNIIGGAVEQIQGVQLDGLQKEVSSNTPSFIQQIEDVKLSVDQVVQQNGQFRGGQKEPPKLQVEKLLDASMHGVSEEVLPDGSVGLVVNYSFEKHDELRKYEAAPFGIKEVDASTYRQFTEKEKDITLDVLGEIESDYQIRYVETSPEEAYFSFGAYQLGDMASGKEVAGSASFPKEDGGYVLIDADSELSRATMRHEILHGHGARHTFQSEDIQYSQTQFDSYNASIMAYPETGRFEKTYDNLAPQAAEVGGGANIIGLGQPDTFQLLDHQFLENYGRKAERPQKQFVLDADQSFYGTFHTRQDDSFHVEGNSYGVIDLRGGVENPSIVFNSPIEEGHLREYGDKSHEKNMFFFNETPSSTVVEGGAPVIVMGDKASNLTIETADAKLFLSGAANQIDLGMGQEELIVNENSNATVVITDFDIYKDTVRYNQGTQSVELSGSAEETVLTFAGVGGAMAGSQVILKDCPVSAFEQRFSQLVQPISEVDKEALINGKRPTIEIQPGDNGIIGGYNDRVHALQYNDPDALNVKYQLSHDVGQTHIKVVGTSLQSGASEFAAFTVDGEYDPRSFSMYCNGKEVECGHATITQGNLTYKWRTDEYETFQYVDRRNAGNHSFSVRDGEVQIIKGSQDQRISVLENDEMDTRPVQIYRDGSIGDLGVLTLALSSHENTSMLVNKIDVEKDVIQMDNLTSAKLTETAFGSVLVLRGGSDPENQTIHCIALDEVQGDPANISCVSQGFNFETGEPTQTNIPLKLIPAVELTQQERMVANSVSAHNSDDDLRLTTLVEKYFPDVLDAIAPQQELQTPEIPQKSGGGRGR